MIEDSSLVKMRSCKECYISNSTVELSKIVNSNLFSSNLYQSHLLDCNVFKGSCNICEIKNTKMAHLKMVQAYVSESEMTDWTYCYDCCIHQSDIFQIVLNNSIYYRRKICVFHPESQCGPLVVRVYKLTSHYALSYSQPQLFRILLLSQ